MMNPNLEEWLMSKLPGPLEEPEKTEELETHVKEEPETHAKEDEESVPVEMEVPVEEVEEEMLTSMSLVLKTNRFPTVLGRILSFLDSRSVKKAALVSR